MWSVTRWGVLVVALAACRAVAPVPLDTSLPDGVALAVEAAPVVLEAGAADRDPDVRAPALVGLVLGASGEARDAWVRRGLADPDPWVARAVLGALGPDRAARASFVADPVGEPITRAVVALEEGLALPPTARTDAVEQLAVDLVAGVRGDAAARGAAEAAIAEGVLPDDAWLFAALATHGWPELAGALTSAERWVEPEATLRPRFVRDLLGDATGASAWRDLVRAEPSTAWDLLDVVARMPLASRHGHVQAVGARAEPLLRTALALVDGPSASERRRALAAESSVAGLAFVDLAPTDADLVRGLATSAFAGDDPWVVAEAALAVARAPAACDALRSAPASRWMTDDRDRVRTALAAARHACGEGR